MIPLELAVKLKKAGLIWQADIHDFFGIPDRGLDERTFVISDMMANLDIFRGWPVVTFHGAAEWALDYILTTDVVWVPTESQLRQELTTFLRERGEAMMQLTLRPDGYQCSITFQREPLTFIADTAEEAYAQALLYLLQQLPENK